jgi:hypothetical protein
LSSDGEHIDSFYIVASATFFLAGEILKVGSTIQELHKPVPEWEKKLGIAVSSVFGVTPTGKPMPEQLYQPTYTAEEARKRSLVYVNKRVSTSAYRQVQCNSPYISAVRCGQRTPRF